MASLVPHLRIKGYTPGLSALPKHSLRVNVFNQSKIPKSKNFANQSNLVANNAHVSPYLKTSSFCNQRYYSSNSSLHTKNEFLDDTNKSIVCNETTIKLLQPKLLPRTHNIGEITSDMVGQEVRVAGWVSSQRYLGKLVFVLLRDMHGSIQLKYQPPANVEEDDISKALRDLSIESIIAIKGTVAKRPPEMINEKLKSGDLEIVISQYELLNPSSLPPFDLRAEKLANEELRLKYRFLDLRRPALQRNILLRSRVAQITRNYFWDNGFTEIETPTLFKATPECGAKEFLVPTREKGKFYALPQSPQQYKQITMASGIDKYFQLARCYRDEGIHPDRQPEFTQVDLEISFARPNDIYKTIEGLLKAIWKKELGVDIPTPFPHMQFEEAMSKYGIDKPDTRYALHIKDITSVLQQSNTSVKLFKESIQQGQRIKCINFKSLAANATSEDITTLVNEAKKAGAKDLLVIKLVDGEWKNPIAKHLTEQEKSQLSKELDAQNGDLLCFSIGEHYAACSVLGKVRIAGASLMKNKSLLSIPSNQYNFMWVVDFPLFSWEDNQMVSTHNPFTSPHPDDAQLLLSNDIQDLLKIRALHYDCVLNGVEIGGGSIRIHNADLQTLVFKKLKINPQLFNHLLEALRYGCPPHGGLALGYDRLVSIMCGAKSLREVIAFPKSTNGNELMTGSPAYVSNQELQELGLQILPQPKPAENT